MSAAIKNPALDNNPWKGLNFYREGEILYGRDDEIQSLALYVTNNTQTVLYGKSGIGKSSIINAGLFPIARNEGLFPISIRLKHDKDTTYISQIKTAFEESQIGITPILDAIDNSKETLWEYLHRNTFYHTTTNKPVRPLIVLDQFEEIFTLQHDEKKKETFFSELADLLNEVMPNYIANNVNSKVEKKAPNLILNENDFAFDFGVGENGKRKEYLSESLFNIVFTIREDFLSYLERYTKFIPVMKSNRYALLPISEEQAKDIIMKPVDGLVDIEVAKLIIQKVSGRTDFELGDAPEIEVDAAILSLYLSRLYTKKGEKNPTITAALVNEFSEDIIKNFYEESIGGFPTQEIEKLEDLLLTYDNRRNNVSRNDLKREGISEKLINTLVEKRKLLRQFSYQEDIRIEYIHDILCDVVKERIENREQLAKEKEEKERQEKERKIQEEKLKKAEEEKARLRAEAVEIRRKNRKRLRNIAIVATVIALLVLGWYDLWHRPYSVSYGNFTIVNGWPVGLGEEVDGANEKRELFVYYKLTREGRMPTEWNEWLPERFQGKPFTKVEICNPNGKLTTNKFYETPIVRLIEYELDDAEAKTFAGLQRETAYWVYSPGDVSFKEVARCTAYNLEDKELYSIQYYRDNTFVSNDSSKYVQWAVFNDANGKQMKITHKGIDRMRQTIKNGNVASCLFFTELGTPQQNVYGAYGYQFEVDSMTHLVSKQYCVDKFGTKIDSTAIDYYDYKYGRIKKTSLYEVSHPKENMITYKYKNYTDTLLFNKNGTIGMGVFHIEDSKVVFKYDENSQPLLTQKYLNENLVESKQYTYLSQSSMISEISVIQDSVSYIEKYIYPNDSTVELTLWRNNCKYAQWRQNEYSDSLYYHKSIKTTKMDKDYITETTEYQDTLGNPISKNSGEYAKYSRSKDKITKNVKLEYFYDAQGEIYKSEWFDYDEYGNRIARAVAGIGGKPVRCPNWDWEHMCYFKMAFLRDFSDNMYIAVKGVDEFGDQSYIIQKSKEGNVLYELFELPMGKIELLMGKTTQYGFSIAQNRKVLDYNIKEEIPYLHILSVKGELYNASFISGISKKISDGDIIYRIGAWNLYDSPSLLKKEWEKIEKEGGNIEILTLHKQSYKLQKYYVNAGFVGAEYHFMPITQSVINRIK